MLRGVVCRMCCETETGIVCMGGRKGKSGDLRSTFMVPGFGRKMFIVIAIRAS